MSQGRGKSDRGVVPKKPANKAAGATPAAAEPVEGRPRAKGNANAAHTRRTPWFTTMMHHVHGVERLQAAYFVLKRDAAAGVDGMTWHAYGQDPAHDLQELSGRLARGGRHAKPGERADIEKAD